MTEGKSFKQELYDRVFNLIVEDTKSFALITRKLLKNINTYPAVYVGITDSEKINLSQSVGADITNFDIIIMANNPTEVFDKSGNEILLELAYEIEYALAKPANWNTNHLGFPGRVKDCYFTRMDLYDDESSAEGDIACVMSFSVVHVGEAILRPMQKQNSF